MIPPNTIQIKPCLKTAVKKIRKNEPEIPAF